MVGPILAAAAAKPSPFLILLEHLVPHRYFWAPIWKVGPFDLTPTNAVLNIIAASAITVLVFWIAASKSSIIPKGIHNMIEVAIDFVKENIVYTVMNSSDGRVWFPFIGTIFFLIFFMNAIGIIPIVGFTPTSNIYVTGALALAVYLLAATLGMVRHGPIKFWAKTLIPPDIPKMMIPLMFVIEIVSQIARPFSLAVRLFANMLADHVILLIFVGFIFLIGGGTFAWAHLAIVPLAMVFEVIFTAFGLFVAFIQAVIFAFLSTIYINDALHPGH